jgi:energy-coupling factor transporter ATP-binding protein EcfA2
MIDWDWNGARWWKFDLHTHTPASNDFGRGPDREQLARTEPREWLLAYMAAEVDCVAVTDHNSGAWVDRLKAALDELRDEGHAGYRELTLFPGVEVSVNGGVHLLAIFDPSKSTSDIDSLLGAVGFPNAKKGTSEAVTDKAFAEVVEAIVSHEGLPIPAHVDQEKGIWREFSGQTLAKALGATGISAVEVVDMASDARQTYDAQDLNWSEVVGSDSHQLTISSDGSRGPGTRFSWVKMGVPNIEGLRLALLDRDTSVQRCDATSADPNTHSEIAIESLTLRDARYMGRGTPLEINFNPWLNTIIGGRGTGKSTLIEMMRLVLRRENELPARISADFEKYRTAYENRAQEGLLTPSTQIELIYRRDSARFRLQWSLDGTAEAVSVHGAEGWEPEGGSISRRFPVRVYSQKQIFELARDPMALLQVIDDSTDVNRAAWNREWDEEVRRSVALRAKAREIEGRLQSEEELRAELSDVRRRLEVFEGAGHRTVLANYQRRLRQGQAADDWEAEWIDAPERVTALADELVPETLPEDRFDLESDPDAEFHRASEEVRSKLAETAQQLKDIARSLDAQTIAWRERRATSRWQEAVTTALGQYAQLCSELEAADVADPSEYGAHVQQRQQLERRLADLDSERSELVRVREAITQSQNNLDTLRTELTRRRAMFLQETLKGHELVRIELVPLGAADVVVGSFRSVLAIDGNAFERDVGEPARSGLLGKLFPSANTPEEDTVEERLAGLKAKLRAIAAGHEPAQDVRFARYLEKLAPEQLDKIDMWYPEDGVNVRYRQAGAGFVDIAQGSPGQRTATLLAFLLSYGNEPIILDQPEDDLDNAFIYDPIVTTLKQAKLTRQIIVVTHNANIVVNGDAELILPLAVRGGQTVVDVGGSLQESLVRDAICTIMEGGARAFSDRYRRIGPEARHV